MEVLILAYISKPSSLPVIDISALRSLGFDQSPAPDQLKVAVEIFEACRDSGFFYIRGHGVSEDLQSRLDHFSRLFFALNEPEKMKIAMSLGGRAWRGYFPVGGELTSGKPDLKEGLYFGSELPGEHPLVKAGTPLHGPNLFPSRPTELKLTVLEYIGVMTQLGHTLMRGIALSLSLDANLFEKRFMQNPLTLFRIFHYPPPAFVPSTKASSGWGVGEHTDYGVLTILKQDENGGLEVKTGSQWISAPPIPGTFVVNIGDMLDRMTGGLYKSTPHRVQNVSGRSRLSFPFFFDPNFDVKVYPLKLEYKEHARDDSQERWDQANPHAFEGTYGEYLLRKIEKVFPQLRNKVLK